MVKCLFTAAMTVQTESRSQIYLDYAEVQPVFANAK